MLQNFLSLLVLVGLVGLFGWLTLRAWRAKPRIVRWLGGSLTGLIALALAGVTFVALRGLAFMYIAPASVPDLTVEGTPDQIARGEYLASVACVGCHGADGRREFPLSGGVDLSAEIPIPIGNMVVANLTPGGVLAERSDGELFRSIRYGFGRGARAPVMTFMPYRQLSDDDTEALIAFLRSQEPVETPSPGGTELNILGATLLMGAGLQPLPETTDGPITAPPTGDQAAYGEYVATIGECRGCHGPDMTGTEPTLFSPGYMNPRPLVAALEVEAFIDRMRTGKRPDGSEIDMPWRNAAAMTDEDLAALYAYLTSPVD